MARTERVRSPDELVQDARPVEEALAKAVSDALRRHKRTGNAIVESREGTVRWLSPDEIPDLEATTED